MTGFIRNLFGGNKKPPAPKPPKPPKADGAFFLNEDEAKTLGDIDYMRSSKVIKRTFARKKGQTEELESVRQVSAMEKREINEFGVPVQREQTASASAAEPSTSFDAQTFRRRQSDNSMDMFRDMAKDLKK